MPSVDEQLFAQQLREEKNRGEDNNVGVEESDADDLDDSQDTAGTLRSEKKADMALKSLAGKNVAANVGLKVADAAGVDVVKWFKIMVTAIFSLQALMIFGIILAIGFFITVDKWVLLKSLWIYLSPAEMVELGTQAVQNNIIGK